MQMVDDARVVVYLMTGFLESGKTSFLKQTIDKQYFKIDGTTVIILCEEGEEEYEEDLLARAKAKIVTVEDPEELTKEFLQEVEDKYHPERVIFECNGMYPVSKMEALDVPDGWGLIQEITTVDASTFDVYIANMKSLFVEMVRNADMVLFNRCTEDMPLAGYRRSVKVVNQGAQIIFEGAEGEIEDIFSDQMPYDLDAPVIKIEDMDYGIWYVDMMDNPEKYKGKVVEIQGRARKAKGFPKGEFVLGRSAMTCCADDIRFYGYPCNLGRAAQITQRSWKKVTVKFEYEAYRPMVPKQPVLYMLEMESAEKPEEEVVYLG